MAVDPNIKNKAQKIRTEVYGKDVRESLASGLEAMSEDVVQNKNRQNTVEQQFQDVLDTTTDKDFNSAPEIKAARGNHSNLAQRLLSVNQQLAQNAQHLDEYDEALKPFTTYEPPMASDEWVTDNTGKVLNITSDQFLNLFYNPHIGTKSDGYKVTRTSKGKDQSGVYDLFEYDFCPTEYEHEILLSSGMHTYELPASFGLGHLINRMMTNPDAHSFFKYMREKVRIKVIPIVNPWGFNQNPKTYGNSRGVNINRNFDYNSLWASFPNYSPNPDDSNYNEWNVKGEAPYSESETRILHDWVLSNSNAKFWIDCHTGLKSVRADIWVYTMDKDPLFNQSLEAISINSDRIKNRYGKVAVVQNDINPPEMLRQFWSLNTAGVSTITMEFSERNWGTDLNNEGADITEYEAQLIVYISSLLGIKGAQMQEFVQKTGSMITALSDKLNAILNANLTIAQDDFNRVDGSLLNNLTPVGDRKWYAQDDPKSFTIVSNKAKAKSSYAASHAFVDVGVTDMEVSADITFNSYAGLYVRAKDVRDYVLVRMNSTNIAVLQGIDGVETNIGSHSTSHSSGQMYQLKVRVKGTELKVYFDGNLIITTVIKNSGLTSAGMRTTNDTTSTFDNFKVKMI